MIRLFVGLQIPDEIRLRMASLTKGVDGARWVAEENLHITLRFIGEVSEDRAEDVTAALDGIRSPPFDVTVTGAGHFESRGRVRTLWFGVEKSPPLMALHDRIDTAITREGFPAEGRRYAPHVTIARLKDVRPGAIHGWLAANTLFRAIPFEVGEFVLFSSHLGRKGASYTPEVRFPLAGDA